MPDFNVLAYFKFLISTNDPCTRVFVLFVVKGLLLLGLESFFQKISGKGIIHVQQ